MRRALREVEERTGQQIFRTQDDAQLQDSDLVEAWSHLSLSLYVGRSAGGEELAQGFDEKGYRRTMIELLGTEAGPAMRSQRTLLEGVYRRAAALNGLKKQGVLDAELESTLAWQLGLEGRRGGESAVEEGGAQEQGRAQRELESGAVVAPSASAGVMTLESSAVADFSGPSFSLIPGEGTQASAETERISRFLLGPVTATSLGTEVPAFPRMAELLDWVAADWQKRTGGCGNPRSTGRNQTGQASCSQLCRSWYGANEAAGVLPRP